MIGSRVGRGMLPPADGISEVLLPQPLTLNPNPNPYSYSGKEIPPPGAAPESSAELPTALRIKGNLLAQSLELGFKVYSLELRLYKGLGFRVWGLGF